MARISAALLPNGTNARPKAHDALSVRGDGWWPGAESNHRHADFQSAALPTELPGLGLELLCADCRAAPARGSAIIAARPRYTGVPRLLRERSTPSCLSLRYRCVRSRPVFSATRVIEPFSLARWNSK